MPRMGRVNKTTVCGFTGCEASEGLYHRRCPEHRGVEDSGRHKKHRDSLSPEEKAVRNRKYNLIKHYSISEADYQAQLIKQGGVCALCKTLEPGGRWDVYHVDHDHETGKLRGLLCNSCNIALGKFRDNTETLKQAIIYLEAGGVW